jgi:hypothetical protein
MFKNTILGFIGAAVIGASAITARADLVTVDIKGSVEWNFITAPPLGLAHVGDAADLTFTVDSNNFVNSPTFPTRGFPIDKSSFVLKFPNTQIGLLNPYPAGQTPYFVLRNNDPQVDGFFVATNVNDFAGVPLNQPGVVGPYANEFHATYGGNLLSSLDILGALGHYDFTGLSVFNWTLDDGPNNAMGILFSDMTISAVPEPAALGVMLVLSGACALGRRQRRTRC